MGPTTSADVFTSLRSYSAKTMLCVLQDVRRISTSLQKSAHFEILSQVLDRFSLMTETPKPDRIRRVLLRLLTRLAGRSNELPPTLFVTKIELERPEPVAWGGFADVLRGKMGDVVVALKRLRPVTAIADERIEVNRVCYNRIPIFLHPTDCPL